MALCTSCGNQVEDSASFCTSCGKSMPAAAHPSAAVSVTRPVCSSCGAPGDPGSVFCTECGKRLDAEAAPTVSSSAVVVAPTTSVVPVAPALEVTQPVRVEPGIAPAVSKEPTRDAFATKPVAAPPSRVESTPAAVAAEPLVENRPVVEDRPVVAVPSSQLQLNHLQLNHLRPAPQVAAPVYATPSDYPPAQPSGGAFRIIVLVLLLLIVVGGFGGWYFMGVETVIVCSPPDVTVFLDGKELPPTSYGDT